MTVTCGHAGCDWGVLREFEHDAWNALYAHLSRVHDHDVYADKERTPNGPALDPA